MRLFEFDNQLAATVKSNLIWYRDLSKSKSIETKAFVNLLQKQHILISADALVDLINNDLALKNMVTNAGKDDLTMVIKFKDEKSEEPVDTDTDTEGSEEPEEKEDEKDNIEDRVDTMAKGAKGSDRVAKMASSAAKRRS